jgi:predicted CXXCH cytochrome family protein
MNKQNARKTIFFCTVIAAIAGITAMVLADDKKEVPDHTNFQSCQTCHAEKQSMWEASGHSKAIGRIASAKQASADCYACHSTEGFAAKLQGNKVDIAGKESFHTVSCLACHDPVRSKLPRRLVADQDKLCESCHRQRAVLRGEGAKGIDDIRFVHSAVSCVSCHMTEGNHLMKVLRPDDPNLGENRKDSCTPCHKDSKRDVRAKQIQEWQAEYKEKMDVLQDDLKVISSALKEKPDLLNAELKARLGDARTNLSILERDGSRGAHNPDLALEIMAVATRTLKEVKAAVK